MRRILVAAVAACALLAAAPSAHAATFEFGMEDEGLVLSNQLLALQAVDDWHALGVDVVRIHARWWEIAPQGTKKPAGFNANNPNDPQYKFANLDNAVAIVRNAGINVMLTITGPGPVWTSSEPTKNEGRWKPSPTEYASFARAVATRYKAQVSRYLLWNEPNQKGWLQPQWQKSGKTWTPVSPHIYRGLVNAAVPAVKAADPGSEIVIGELAPVGNRADQRPDADGAAAVPALPRLRRRQVQERSRPGSARASRRRRRRRWATTRIRSSARPTRSTRTSIRRSSATCRACSRRSTSCAPTSA